jgi:hypothetical protein
MVWGGECRFCVANLGQAPPIAILHPNVRGRERKDWGGSENLADPQMSGSGVMRPSELGRARPRMTPIRVSKLIR